MNIDGHNKNDLTCAHKSLPFGTKVRITRIDNKKSVVVRVNDRGPFVEGFVVDVSRRAAEEIGLVRDGVTRVQVEVIEAASTARVAAEADGNTRLLLSRSPSQQTTSAAKIIKGTKPTAYSYDPVPARFSSATASTSELYKVDIQSPLKVGYGVQISTLSDADNVLPVLKQVQTQWPGKSMVLVETNAIENNAKYKVIVGPYSDKKTAEAQQKLAEKRKYKGCFVVYLGDL